MFRLKDRKGADYCLAPTHEELITNIVSHEVNSCYQLPLILYQIGPKYRDEMRPRGGLLRCREFIMKDAYSFDVNEEAAFTTYHLMMSAYRRIMNR
jgi:prolyl-tRNA synthetase